MTLERVGRYVVHDEIAQGGMGTVHFGRLVGAGGFGRTVALKRLHANLARDPELRAMFLSEAKIAARVVHPNVVATLDVVEADHELFVVMDYVHGESLDTLRKEARGPIKPAIAVAIVVQILHALHAAHETKSERGEPLRIIHRDVSPQNVIVATDGNARLLDFGVAKAANRLYTTRDHRVKGKLGYIAPEQLRGGEIDRRVDVYAAAVVLWEALAGERLFTAESDVAQLNRVLFGAAAPPSARAPDVPKALDAVVLRGIEREPASRFATAREMALALQSAVTPAAPNEVAEWLDLVASDDLAVRAERLAQIEALPDPPEPAPVSPGPPSVGAVPPRRPPLYVYGVAATVVALGVLAWAGLRARSTPSERAIASMAPSSAKVADPEPTPELSASSLPSPFSSAASAALAGSAAPADAREPRRAAKGGGRRVDCNPPYTRSESGVKVYKRECL